MTLGSKNVSLIPCISAHLSLDIRIRNSSTLGRICCILRLQKCNPLDEKDNLGAFVCECWDKQVESSEDVLLLSVKLSD